MASSTGRVANSRRPFIRLSRNASFDIVLRVMPTTQNLSGNRSGGRQIVQRGDHQPVGEIARGAEDDEATGLGLFLRRLI